jgi:hypothetical protein
MIKLVASIILIVFALGVVCAKTPPGPPAKRCAPCGPRKHCAERRYDLASSTVTGDVVRGPRTIVAENLDILRYDYKWNSTISFQAPPDLWTKLTTVTTTPPATPPAAPTKAGKQPADLTQQAAQPRKGAKTPGKAPKVELPDTTVPIQRAEDRIHDTEVQITSVSDHRAEVKDNLGLIAVQQNKANEGIQQVANAGKALSDFLSISSRRPEQIVSGINDQLKGAGETSPSAIDSIFIAGIKATWADLAALAAIRSSSQLLGALLADLKGQFASYVPHQTAALEASKAELTALIQKIQEIAAQDPSQRAEAKAKTDLLTSEISRLGDEQDKLGQAARLLDWEVAANNQTVAALSDLDVSSSKYSTFRSAQELLVTWKTRMENILTQWHNYSNSHDEQVNPNPFNMEICGDCHFAFSRTKTNALILSRTDLKPGTTSTSPETVLSVTVECTSPFTISAGVAFSTIQEHEFGIQAVATPPGSTTTTNQFVSTAKSAFHPLPIGMVHARLWEPSDFFSVHVSFGVAGNIRSQNSGGSDPEYLIGPSFALFRTMFLTPGLHLGREVKLGAGFKEGDPVPSNITTPPLQKSYKPAFGFAITFTKP